MKSSLAAYTPPTFCSQAPPHFQVSGLQRYLLGWVSRLLLETLLRYFDATRDSDVVSVQVETNFLTGIALLQVSWRSVFMALHEVEHTS